MSHPRIHAHVMGVRLEVTGEEGIAGHYCQHSVDGAGLSMSVLICALQYDSQEFITQ